MSGAWWLTVGAHSVLVVGYAWIAAILFIGNTNAKQWRANPLATATFLIFASCGLGHGLHVYHAFEEMLGLHSSSTVAARLAMSDPLLVIWSVVTAAVALWYLALRGRLHLVSAGAPLCADLADRAERAAAMRGPIDAAIDRAQAALEQGDGEAALVALDEALCASRDTIGDLMGHDRGMKIRAGDLRRRTSA